MSTFRVDDINGETLFRSLDNGSVYLETRHYGLRPLITILSQEEAISLMAWLSEATVSKMGGH